jgi:hypothetical protein
MAGPWELTWAMVRTGATVVRRATYGVHPLHTIDAEYRPGQTEIAMSDPRYESKYITNTLANEERALSLLMLNFGQQDAGTAYV